MARPRALPKTVFGRNLTFLRKQKGWTPEETHKMLKVSRAAYDKYEGWPKKWKGPPAEIYLRIAELFRIDPLDLWNKDLTK